jgi:hypothetical protein
MPPLEMDFGACLDSGGTALAGPYIPGDGTHRSIYEFLIDGLKNNSYR